MHLSDWEGLVTTLSLDFLIVKVKILPLKEGAVRSK